MNWWIGMLRFPYPALLTPVPDFVPISCCPAPVPVCPGIPPPCPPQQITYAPWILAAR